MSKAVRAAFFHRHAFGLIGLLSIYVLLTVVRSLRDDFGVEIWQALGVNEKPAVFAKSETVVAIVATVVNALAICIVGNVRALTASVVLMCGGFVVVACAAILQWSGSLPPFPFMVACGIGLYLPYVAFHTTVFERLIAASPRPGNLGFLMYLADSIGYLGYAGVVTVKIFAPPGDALFGLFRSGILVSSIFSIFALLFAIRYFRRVLSAGEQQMPMAIPEVSS